MTDVTNCAELAQLGLALIPSNFLNFCDLVQSPIFRDEGSIC